MAPKRVLPLLPLLLAAAQAVAQAGASQERLEDDCLQRLQPLVPRAVKVRNVDFSALGSNAAYYVVSYRFSGALENGARAAACTYRRDGQWVRDDAAAWKLARDLTPRRPARAD
jgi:hypothetical protein